MFKIKIRKENFIFGYNGNWRDDFFFDFVCVYVIDDIYNYLQVMWDGIIKFLCG